MTTPGFEGAADMLQPNTQATWLQRPWNAQEGQGRTITVRVVETYQDTALVAIAGDLGDLYRKVKINTLAVATEGVGQ